VYNPAETRGESSRVAKAAVMGVFVNILSDCYIYNAAKKKKTMGGMESGVIKNISVTCCRQVA
jgi:hypothetical protein